MTLSLFLLIAALLLILIWLIRSASRNAVDASDSDAWRLLPDGSLDDREQWL